MLSKPSPVRGEGLVEIGDWIVHSREYGCCNMGEILLDVLHEVCSIGGEGEDGSGVFGSEVRD